MPLPGVFLRALAPTKAIERGASKGASLCVIGSGLFQLEAVPLVEVLLRVERRLLLVHDDHLRLVLRRGDQRRLLRWRRLRGGAGENRAISAGLEQTILRLLAQRVVERRHG